MNPQTTIGEARLLLRQFLDRAGCREVCSNCPTKRAQRTDLSPDTEEDWLNTGCCGSCPDLVPGKGCSRPSLTCLQAACQELSRHLDKQGLWEEFCELRENVPFEPWHSRFPDDPREKRFREDLPLVVFENFWPKGNRDYRYLSEDDPRWAPREEEQ